MYKVWVVQAKAYHPCEDQCKICWSNSRGKRTFCSRRSAPSFFLSEGFYSHEQSTFDSANCFCVLVCNVGGRVWTKHLEPHPHLTLSSPPPYEDVLIQLASRLFHTTTFLLVFHALHRLWYNLKPQKNPKFGWSHDAIPNQLMGSIKGSTHDAMLGH